MLVVKVEHLGDLGQVSPCHHEYKKGYLSDFQLSISRQQVLFWP